VPRATFDLDILIEPSPENARRLLDALLATNIGTASLVSVEELLKNEITVFKDRVRLDVRTETPGLTFQKAWQNRQTLDYLGQSFFVVSRDDLIAAKKAAGPSISRMSVCSS